MVILLQQQALNLWNLLIQFLLFVAGSCIQLKCLYMRNKNNLQHDCCSVMLLHIKSVQLATGFYCEAVTSNILLQNKTIFALSSHCLCSVLFFCFNFCTHSSSQQGSKHLLLQPAFVRITHAVQHEVRCNYYGLTSLLKQHEVFLFLVAQ